MSLWAEKEGIVFESSTSTEFEFDDVHKPEFKPELSITNPKAGATYRGNDRVSVTVQSKPNKFPLSKIDMFVNGVFAGSMTKEPFSFSIIPNNISSISEHNTLKIIGYDSVLNRNETEVTFNVTF